LLRIISSILASISYNIDSFKEHYHGPDYKAILQDYDNILRTKLKYTEEVGSFEEARDVLWETLADRGLSVWD
jgi:hypothetical protein